MSGSLAEVCGGLDDMCGSLGEVVCCEVYKNLTKAMKTIQWERQEIEYTTQKMLWERCAEVPQRCAVLWERYAEVWMMCAEVWERLFIVKFIIT